MDGGRIVHAWLLVYRLALLWLLVHRLRRLIGNCRLLHHYYVLVGKHVRRLPCIGTDPDFTALLQCKKQKKKKQSNETWCEEWLGKDSRVHKQSEHERRDKKKRGGAYLGNSTRATKEVKTAVFTLVILNAITLLNFLSEQHSNNPF